MARITDRYICAIPLQMLYKTSVEIGDDSGLGWSSVLRTGIN